MKKHDDKRERVFKRTYRSANARTRLLPAVNSHCCGRERSTAGARTTSQIRAARGPRVGVRYYNFPLLYDSVSAVTHGSFFFPR